MSGEFQRIGSVELDAEQRAALWACARAHPLSVMHSTPRCLAHLAEAMRAGAPQLEGRPFHRWLTVALGIHTEQGDHIQEHAHPEHVIMFYPEATTVDINGVPQPVEAGDVWLMPPGLRHGVPKVAKPRISVAMVIP